MKEFLTGILVLIFIALITMVGSLAWILLFPFFILLGLLLRVLLFVALIIAAIWLLGKTVLFIYKKIGGVRP